MYLLLLREIAAQQRSRVHGLEQMSGKYKIQGLGTDVWKVQISRSWCRSAVATLMLARALSQDPLTYDSAQVGGNRLEPENERVVPWHPEAQPSWAFCIAHFVEPLHWLPQLQVRVWCAGLILWWCRTAVSWQRHGPCLATS